MFVKTMFVFISKHYMLLADIHIMYDGLHHCATEMASHFNLIKKNNYVQTINMIHRAGIGTVLE